MNSDHEPRDGAPSFPAAATGARNQSDLDAKRLATATAKAALRGVVLQVVEADCGRTEFIASLNAFTRAFGSLDDVEAWLTMMNPGQAASGAIAAAGGQVPHGR